SIRQPILMVAAGRDDVVSTPAIEVFGRNLLAGRHLILAGAKHEILQEQDHYRMQFLAAFDAFVPATPRYSAATTSSASGCPCVSPAALRRPRPCAGPFSHVVTMPPAPATIGMMATMSYGLISVSMITSISPAANMQ